MFFIENKLNSPSTKNNYVRFKNWLIYLQHHCLHYILKFNITRWGVQNFRNSIGKNIVSSQVQWMKLSFSIKFINEFLDLYLKNYKICP